MANNLGFSGLNQNLNSQDPTKEIFDNLSILNSQLITGRVVDIILSNKHPLFYDYGGWNGLGTIFFEPTNNLEGKVTTTKSTATPLIPYNKNYPLINEVVVLLNLPSKTINQISNEELVNKYYYINPISIWNSNHHNAFPNLLINKNTNTTKKSYQQIEAGSPNQEQSTVDNIEFNSPLIGGTFIERSNIHPILPFSGDIITEGRWGNSIRLGSTTSGSNNTEDYQNNWSNIGENGDPITIIRNGQPKDSSQTGFLPLVENISKDLSSIYMTSYQQIPLRAANENFTALSPEPLLPREFFKPQIILNSGRLIFNASSDSIIMSAQDSISLSSNKQIGITGEKSVNIISEKISIGSSNATEPALLGSSFLTQFEVLIEQIQVLAIACSGLEGYDMEATNIESSGINEAGQSLEETCQQILSLLTNDDKITSKLLSNNVRIS